MRMRLFGCRPWVAAARECEWEGAAGGIEALAAARNEEWRWYRYCDSRDHDLVREA